MNNNPIITHCLQVNKELVEKHPHIIGVGYTQMYVADTDFGKETHISCNIIFPKDGDLITADGHLIESKYVSELADIQTEKFIVSTDLSHFEYLEKNRVNSIEESIHEITIANLPPEQTEERTFKVNTILRIQEIRANAMKNDEPLSPLNNKRNSI